MTIRIRHLSTYQGESDFSVWDNGEQYRLRYRFSTGGEYLRKHYNGTAEQYQRDLVGQCHIVSRELKPITKDVFNAFVEFLQKQHDDYLKHCKEQIEKHDHDPEIAAIYSAGPACPLVRPGYWDQGWHEIIFDEDEVEVIAHCPHCGEDFETSFPADHLTADERRARRITGPCPDCQGQANGPMNQTLSCFI